MIDRDLVLQQLKRARDAIQAGNLDTGRAVLALLHTQLQDACQPPVTARDEKKIAWRPGIAFYRAAGRIVVAAETECRTGNTLGAAELLRTGIDRLVERGA